MAMGQNPVPPVNIPIPSKIDYKKWVVHPPQNGSIGFDPQPHRKKPRSQLTSDRVDCQNACSQVLYLPLNWSKPKKVTKGTERNSGSEPKGTHRTHIEALAWPVDFHPCSWLFFGSCALKSTCLTKGGLEIGGLMVGGDSPDLSSKKNLKLESPNQSKPIKGSLSN